MISYISVVNSEQVGNEPVKSNKTDDEIPTIRLFLKTRRNVPHDGDYDRLPLASVHEVNYRIKNWLYGYFISKGLHFPLWNDLCTTIEKKPPRCGTCLVYGHSLVDCPKVSPKQLVNRMDKGKVQTSRADDEVKQSAEGKSASSKMTPPIDTNKASSSRKKSNGLSDDINLFSLKRQMLDGKLFLVDDDGKLLKKFDYPVNADSKDKVEQVDNETVIFMSSKQSKSGSGYGTKSLLKQWKETAVDDDNDPYDDDMYDDHDNSICDDWDIKVRGRKKKLIFVVFSHLQSSHSCTFLMEVVCFVMLAIAYMTS
ncbi:hypothetical protein Tco_1224601 [Tanacetum coccineum]